MDNLHAPWRINYILEPKPPRGDKSLFTQIALSDDDLGNYVIARRESCYALLNRYPYTGGHVLVVPYTETPDLNGLSDKEMLAMLKLTQACQNALSQVMHPDGFNIGLNIGKVAGAGVAEHMHIHIVPRWNGDTNFMPIIASTSVLPEALADLAAKLRQALNA
jgi:ATP adenylyltransferase